LTRLAILPVVGLSGGLLVLSFPPLALGRFAWVALVPLLVALDGRRSWAAFGLAYLAGLVFITGSFLWIWQVPGYGLLHEALLGLYLAFYVAVWGWAVATIRRRTPLPTALVAPTVWVTLEYVRAHLGFLGLPWMLLGHTQYLSIPTMQIVSFTGVYGLSFLIVLVNVALADAVLYTVGRLKPAWSLTTRERRPIGSLVSAGLLLAATWLYGVSVTGPRAPGEGIAVALVHTNVPRDQKWDVAQRRSILERNESLTRTAAATAPQLIVWPETAVPGDVEHHAPLRQRVSQAAREANVTLLVGSSEHAKFTDKRLLDRRYNSMYLFSPAGELAGHYRKIVLVPFGEYEPLQGIVPWPKLIAATMGSHIPGDRYTVFTLGSVPFSTVICWEIVFPDLVRHFVQRGARFIVNATNEAWFAGTSMPDQMLAISVFRAVENRVAVARSANYGISAIIDPYGRITRRVHGAGPAPTPAEGVLAGEIPLGAAGTFYTRHGDVLALACLPTAVLFLAWAWLPNGLGRRRRHRIPLVNEPTSSVR
jgi:apolipoprotein N-acyltransferase